MSYTTREAIEQRLTASGYRWATDLDSSGHVSEGEAVKSIDPAVLYADNLIAAAIAGLDASTETAEANTFLQDRALDLAAYRAATNGGRRVPSVLRRDYDQAVTWLDEVAAGTRTVPGLAGSGPQTSPTGIVAIQTCDTDRRCCGRRRRWPY